MNEINEIKVASKNDGNKPPVTQFIRQFPRAIAYLSKISEFGHAKYGKEENAETWDNWKFVPNRTFRYEQALGRHLLCPTSELDESGFLSASHTAWNAIAVLESILLDLEALENE